MADAHLPSRLDRGEPPAGRARVDDNTLIAGAVAVAIAGYPGQRLVRQHPALALAAAALAAIGAAVAAVLVARWHDGRAARQDPPKPGIILGSVKRDGLLARPRPFRIP